METRGSFLLSTPPESLWPLLLEPNILAAIMPGGQTVTRRDENEYAGKLSVRVGPLAGEYEARLSLNEVEPHIGLAFDYMAESPNGRLQGYGRLHLQPQDSCTLLSYEAHTTVSGALAQYATPLLETSGRAIVRQSLERLEGLLQNGTAASIASGTWTAPTVPKKAPGRLPPPLPGQPVSAALTLAALAAVLLALILILQKKRRPAESG
ncbi:MAG: hypothetical protein H6659_09320 [Ardenticatenaceae bacterium]|nr:hypothetical protein [Ardenticatenaceae bacterium]MCB8987224.1 hypothetical protein [Ardenticatenaceae bacterium]